MSLSCNLESQRLPKGPWLRIWPSSTWGSSRQDHRSNPNASRASSNNWYSRTFPWCEICMEKYWLKERKNKLIQVRRRRKAYKRRKRMNVPRAEMWRERKSSQWKWVGESEGGRKAGRQLLLLLLHQQHQFSSTVRLLFSFFSFSNSSLLTHTMKGDDDGEWTE